VVDKPNEQGTPTAALYAVVKHGGKQTIHKNNMVFHQLLAL
jgi:hypothetical protein